MSANKTTPVGRTPAQANDRIQKPVEPSELPASTEAQGARPLDALKPDPVDTLTTGQRLDLAQPAGRVRELRRAGHDIATTMQEHASPAGVLHRVGVYRMTGEAR